ncbi:putative ribonuclease H-like domain-containing protein [Tanacetum coccineum]
MVLLEYFHQYLLQNFLAVKSLDDAKEIGKPSGLEGLEKGYDRFQQLLSQLEAHGAEVSTEDANHKFLRSLPPAWSNLAMTMRTKPDVDTLSIDDLYNNLRVFEQELTSTSKSSASAQNVAFVSHSKSSTNKVKSGHTGAYSTYTPTSSNNIQEREVPAGFADEIDDIDIEEMDINWQIAMIAIRMKKFYKKTGRRVRIDGNKPVGFDKKKLECFKCHNTGHFARECPSKGTNDGKKKRLLLSKIKELDKERARIRTIDNFKGVPHPLTRDYTLKPQEEISDSDDNSTEHSTCQSNGSEGSCGNTSEHSSESKSESISVPNEMSISNLGHLIKDCDYYEKKMAREVEFKKQRVFNTGNRVAKPVWTNANRVNHANHFIPRPLQLNVGRPNVNSVRPNVNTGRVNVNSVKYNVNSVRTHVNIGRTKQPVPTCNTNMFRNKGINKNISNCLKSIADGVADERMNRTLIEAARTMLADSLLPTTFWAEAVSTACYIFNRIRVIKLQNKTPYELLFSHKPMISYIRPFGYHVTILDTFSILGKFDGKSDEGFLVGYLLNSKAYRVYNLVTKRVEVNLHVNFLEEKPNVKGVGYRWMFNIDYLTDSMNYIPVSLENQVKPHAGTSAVTNHAGTSEVTNSTGTSNTNASEEEDEADELIIVPTESINICRKRAALENNTTSTPSVNTGNGSVNTGKFDASQHPDTDDSDMPELKIFNRPKQGIFDAASYDEEGVVTDFNNLPTEVASEQTSGVHALEEPKKISEALDDEVGLSYAREFTVLGCNRQEEGIDYDEVFAPVDKYISYQTSSAPRAWYALFKLFLEEHGYRRGTIDKTLFIKKDKKDIMLVQVYVDDIIFGSTRKSWYMLKKFDLASVKTAITPIETKMALTKDEENMCLFSFLGPKERKAVLITDIGTQFDLRPHMESPDWTEINAGIQQHLQKAYNTNKAAFKAQHWVIDPTTGTYQCGEDQAGTSRGHYKKSGKLG